MSHSSAKPRSFHLHAPSPLSGTIRVPGDKSISHRAIILGSMAVGETRIEGLLEGEDVLATAAAMRAMGATMTRDNPGSWRVSGVGVGGLVQPQTALDMGNSGTSTRLLLGLVASHPITATFTGDASLSKRPMARVVTPLSLIGARFATAPGTRLPLTITGAQPAIPLSYRLPVASAQVKSAILLAGLNIAGETTVIEPTPTRDHSERMLRGFGADIRLGDSPQGRTITIIGERDLTPCDITIPADISSAAFPIVAALITPGSRVEITHVGVNPTRDGLLRALDMMGAKITRQNPRLVGGEPTADLLVEASALHGAEIPPDIAPSMIDEYPALFIAAAFARGKSVMRGLEELRVKESDRIACMAAGLTACGIKVEELEDGLIIHGRDGSPAPGGTTVASHLDHRIAMSFAILGLHATSPIRIDDARPIATSFPDFESLMTYLGAGIVEAS